MNIIKLMDTNIEEQHICCAFSDKKCVTDYQKKKDWLKTEFKNGYTFRLVELRKAKDSCIEFLLMHQLYLSDRTGQIIHKDFLRLAYPDRWKYSILRALDCFQHGNISWDDRMQPAIDVLFQKRNKNGTWNVQAKYPGQIHFEMEKAGKPSRWNTLRVLRVMQHFGIAIG